MSGQIRMTPEQMRDLITDISTQLDQTATAVEQLDQDIASKFGA
jgi:uncharacterized protein YukE